MRRTLLFGLILATSVGFTLAVLARSTGPIALAANVPSSLTDQEFWSFIQQTSEPGGYFRVAEHHEPHVQRAAGMQDVIPDLVARDEARRRVSGRRTRAELHLHGGDPAGDGDHLRHPARQSRSAARCTRRSSSCRRTAPTSSRMLFSKPRPAGSAPMRRPADLFARVRRVPPSEALYRQNLQAIEDQLTKTHGLPLPARRSGGIRRGLPDVLLERLRRAPVADVRRSDDRDRSRPASPQLPGRRRHLRVAEGLESTNLVVPVVGDFGGPEGDSRDRRVPQGARRHGDARSICRTSSNISTRTASGTRSAATWRRCRSTPRARSSGRPAVAEVALAAAGVRLEPRSDGL